MERFYDLRKFWRKVDMCQCASEQCSKHCWLWSGACNERGYGATGYRLYGLWTVQAHRVAWVVRHQRQPAHGIDIVQTCGQRLCCNPAHLDERPRALRGRQKKLTQEQQVTLLLAYQEGWTQVQLAHRFGISQPAVSYVINVIGPRIIKYD